MLRSKKNDTNQACTTSFQNFITGIISGITDISITHPFWNLQVMSQDGLKAKDIWKIIVKNPIILYKGVLQNASTFVPLTAVRIGLSGTCENYFVKNSDHELSGLHKLSAPFLVGAFSSLVSSPTELIRTIKIKSSVLEHPIGNSSFLHITKSYIEKEGIGALYKGTPVVAMRDGLYTAAVFRGPQVVKEIIEPYFVNPFISTLASFSITSFFAALANTPFDTIKTNQHLSKSCSYLNQTFESGSFTEACYKIYQTDGVKGFYKGFIYRIPRLSGGIVIRATIIEKMDEYWNKYNGYDKHKDDICDLLGYNSDYEDPPEL
jgi:hypothetical protein